MPLGFTEIALIVIVVLLLFGAKRIPDLARSLGRASHEFKKGQKESDADAEEAEKAGKDSSGKDAPGA